MNYNVHEQLVVDISSEIKIHYDTLESAGSAFSKINIYNPQIEIPLHKFWFYIENARVLDISDTKVNIKIALSEISHGKLIKYINQLEDLVSQHLKGLTNTKHNKNIDFNKSIIYAPNFYPALKFKCTLSTNIYNDEDIIIKSLNKNDTVSLYIELANLWINNETQTSWACYQALQIKKNNIYDPKKSMFINRPIYNKNNNNDNNNNNNKQQLYTETDVMPSYRSSTNIPPPPPMKTKTPNKLTTYRLAISSGELLNQLGKLKKINVNKNENPDENSTTNNVDKLTPLTTPPKLSSNAKSQSITIATPSINIETPSAEKNKQKQKKEQQVENKQDINDSQQIEHTESDITNFDHVMKEMIKTIKRENKKLKKDMQSVDNKLLTNC